MEGYVGMVWSDMEKVKSEKLGPHIQGFKHKVLSQGCNGRLGHGQDDGETASQFNTVPVLFQAESISLQNRSIPFQKGSSSVSKRE